MLKPKKECLESYVEVGEGIPRVLFLKRKKKAQSPILKE